MRSTYSLADELVDGGFHVDIITDKTVKVLLPNKPIKRAAFLNAVDAWMQPFARRIRTSQLAGAAWYKPIKY